LTQTRSENKPLLQDDAGFLQEITSTAVEVGLEMSRLGILANPLRIFSWHTKSTLARQKTEDGLPGKSPASPPPPFHLIADNFRPNQAG
jgi:hypothetical protein